jgi:hypothetical protein
MLRPAGGMRDRLSDAFATELQAGAAKAMERWPSSG